MATANTTATDVVSIRLPHEVNVKLTNLATRMKRKKSDLLLAWIEEGLELEQWQLEEIEQGINEADEGKFASLEEVERVFSRYNI
jgi:predicted transcriptional regulator